MVSNVEHAEGGRAYSGSAKKHIGDELSQTLALEVLRGSVAANGRAAGYTQSGPRRRRALVRAVGRPW